MAEQGWIDSYAAPILVASVSAGLQGAEQKRAESTAWLVSKHKTLLSMDADKAKSEYKKLRPDVQEALTSFWGDQKYNEPERNLLQTAGHLIGQAASSAGNMISSYGEAISTPFRAAAIAMGGPEKFFDRATWDKASDGSRVFDTIREKRVDSFYGPEFSKIAKRLSMGDSLGSIVADLQTQEEWAAFEKSQKDPAYLARALRDYDNARISPGRGLAHLFDLDPNIGQQDQGLEGFLYKMISGITDAAVTIGADPTTWLFTPVSAIRNARYGVSSILIAEQASKGLGSYTAGQKFFMRFGQKFGVDATFDITNRSGVKIVEQAFNEIGPNLELMKKSADATTKAEAMYAIQRKFPEFTDTAIKYMADNGVKDATTAREFFKNTDLAENIIQGKVGSMQMMIPRATVMGKTTRAMADLARKYTTGAASEKATTLATDDVIQALSTGEVIPGIENVKKIKLSRDKFFKSLERAMIKDYVYVDGENVAESMKSVYTLARQILPSKQAQLVANAFGLAGDAAQRRNIITGLYDNLANHLGITATSDGKAAYFASMNKVKNAAYSSEAGVDDITRQTLGLSDVPGKIDPSKIDGVSHAIAEHQLSDKMHLPKLYDMINQADKNLLLKSFNGAANNAFTQWVTDMWSAMNLLPRLGLRSVLDETLFTYFTLPMAMVKDLGTAYMAGNVRRMAKYGAEKTTIQLGKTGRREIGVGARAFSRFFSNATPEQWAKAMRSNDDMATFIEDAMNNSIFGKILSVTRSGDDAKYVADISRYGVDTKVEKFSHGGASGLVNIIEDGNPDYIGDFAFRVQEFKKEFGHFSDIPSFIRMTDPEGNANLFVQLEQRIDRNGKIGQIVMDSLYNNVDDPAMAASKAVNDIVDYLKTPEGAKLYQKFDISNLAQRDIRSNAASMYLHVRGILVDDAGNLNKELVRRTRVETKTGVKYSTRHLTLDDIEEVRDGLPSGLMGYSKNPNKYITKSDLLARGMDEMFRVSDRQVATLTREPVYHMYYLAFRRQFGSLEKGMVDRMIAENPGMKRELAEDIAARHYTNKASDMAINRAIGFIDNPEVRSQLAFSARNVSRYYRATEDFYRRAFRVVKNGPEAIMRLRLSQQGLEHAGFIHEDADGDKYFFFPMDNIMYAVTSPFIRFTTGEWPKQPMPVGFGGKLKMLTPSLDVESNVPTFSSPLAALGITAIMKSGLIPPEWQDKFQTATLGKYSTNQSFLDMVTPTFIRRSKLVVDALSGVDNEQIVSAAFKAAAFYSSDPKYKMPDASSDLFERNQAMYDVQATARNIVFLRNLIGIFSPVSPQILENKDVPKELLDAGMVSFKTEFHNLLAAEFDKGTPDAYSTALQKFTKAFPGRLAYTVATTEQDRVATIRQSKEAISWIKSNEGLVRDYKQGSVFLMPQVKNFDMDSYMFLKREGIVQNKSIEQFMSDIATVEAENEYYDLRSSWQDRIDNAINEDHRRFLSDQADKEFKAFKEDKPYLKSVLGTFEGTQVKEDVLQDVRGMLNSGRVPVSSVSSALNDMIKVYDQFRATIEYVTANTDEAIAQRKFIRENASARIQEIAIGNPNAELFYDSILKRLVEG